MTDTAGLSKYPAAAQLQPRRALLLSCIAAGWLATAPGALAQEPPARPPGIAALAVTSRAFADNTPMPDSVRSNLLGCDGANQSPPIEWGEAPVGTQGFALEMIETDGVTGVDYTHWLVFDLPPEAHGLPDGSGSAGGSLPAPAVGGYTEAEVPHYAGPCPLPGQDRPHHYVTTVYALNTGHLGLGAGATLARLRAAIRSKVLAQGSVTGLFGGPVGMAPRNPAAVITQFRVKPGEQANFKAAMDQALSVLARQPGHLSHAFGPAVDDPASWWLDVRWASLADDTDHFQKSSEFTAFAALGAFLAQPPMTVHVMLGTTDGVLR